MTSLTSLFAVVLIVGGFVATVLSFTTRMITGEQIGIAAVAAFACAAALGVWRIVALYERELRDRRK